MLKEFEKRVKKLVCNLEKKEIDGALLTKKEHVYYLTGYYSYYGGFASLFVSKEGECILLLPEDEVDRAKELTNLKDVKGYVSYSVNERIEPLSNMALLAKNVINKRRLRTLGIEKGFIDLKLFERMQLSNINIVDISEIIIKMRMVKTQYEIKKLRRAVKIAEIGLREIQKQLKQNLTEVELLAKAKAVMEAEAGEPIEFFIDIISGRKTCFVGAPIAVADKTKIKRNDHVIADIIPHVSMYWGDLANTFFIGTPSKRLVEQLNIAREAKRAAIKRIKEGALASEIYNAVKKIFDEAGYAKYFPHHAGHGIGIEYFEEPLLLPFNNTKLKKGMVLAIETGIYTKEGGVRAEDDVLVLESGVEVLSWLNESSLF
jgi:Xaa-Pro aminopeptidase